MIPTMFRRSRRCCALLALGGLLAFGAGCTAPTVPVPVPYTISSPDLDGNVSISGDAEVQALVLAFNEDSQEGVIGVADAEGLTKTKAFVVRKAGAAVTEDELKAFVKEKLAPYKYPRQIAFVDDLPKTATGKIQRFKLREQEAGSQ